MRLNNSNVTGYASIAAGDFPGGVTENRDIVSLQRISSSVRRFILDNFMYGYDEGQLSDDTSFIKIGVLDSTGIMEMIELVERNYNIRVKDSEILPENFDSIDRISNYIYGKLNKREAV